MPSLSRNVRKRTFWHVRQRRLRSDCAFAQSDQSLRCPHEEIYYPWLSTMSPVKILIRLCECTGLSESSLGAHIRSYVFWWLISFPSHSSLIVRKWTFGYELDLLWISKGLRFLKDYADAQAVSVLWGPLWITKIFCLLRRIANIMTRQRGFLG